MIPENQTPAIAEVHNLSAGYRRGQDIIKDFSLNVYPGEIIGIIGPNGAGKSTALKAILGLLEKSQGQVILPGREVGGYGYIPELPALYEELTLMEHMELVGMANGITPDLFKHRAEGLLNQFGLGDYRYHYPGGFSKGMRQKIMIMCALITTPALYLVDEPFNGLDPFAVRELLNWFAEEKRRGAGIILSTHVLDVGERICDRFALLKSGRVLAQGSLNQLREIAGTPEADLLEVFIKLAGGDNA